MACSVPTIATRVGGVPELIHDSENDSGDDSGDPNSQNGLLFPVGDVDSMSTAAISLLSNQHRLEAMAKAGRKTAQDHFCSSRVITLYEDYYDRVVTRTQPTH
jgi:glycosyltransferase involved in cell wall biosynthesis